MRLAVSYGAALLVGGLGFYAGLAALLAVAVLVLAGAGAAQALASATTRPGGRGGEVTKAAGRG